MKAAHKLVGVGVCVALVVGLWGVAETVGAKPPEPVPAEPAARAPSSTVGALPIRTATAEAPEPAFTGECGVSVRVVDEAGQPVPEVPVEVRLEPREERTGVETTSTGVAAWDRVACGTSAFVIATAQSGTRSYVRVSHERIIAGEVVDLELDPGLLVTGVVVDAQGRPIEGAWTGYDSDGFTDATGRFTKTVSAQRPSLTVSAEGFRSTTLGAEDLGHPTDLRVVLESTRHIRVTCTGGDPACSSISSLGCQGPEVEDGFLSLMGCEHLPYIDGEAPDYRLCDCPEGVGVVAGGGYEVAFDADTTALTIDLAAGARVTGRLLLDGVPAPGRLSLKPAELGVDLSLADIFSDLHIEVGPDGRFETRVIPEGAWLLSRFQHPALGPFTIPADGEVDLGDIHLTSGGSVEGALLGSVAARQIHSALHVADASAPDVVVMNPLAEPDGTFRASHLSAGTWRIWSPAAPDSVLVVDVEDGVITDGLELSVPDRITVPGAGLVLAFEAPADLDLMKPGRAEVAVTVAEVEAEGPAAEAGVSGGDEVHAWSLPGSPALPEDLEVSAGLHVLHAAHHAVYTQPSRFSLVLDEDSEPVEVVIDR